MTVLESEVARSRVDSAQAAAIPSRLLVLGEEIDRMGKEDRRLAETCGLDARDGAAFPYPGLEKILDTFQPGMISGYGTTWGKSAAVTSLDHVLAVALVQREANLHSRADACEERRELSAQRRAAWEFVASHRDVVSRWTRAITEWDPSLAREMVRLEDEEQTLVQRRMRLEAAEAAAHDADEGLKALWTALHDAVDWVEPDEGIGQPLVPILRSERLKNAEPWIFQVQVLLSRARRALCGTDDLGKSDFQEVLCQFASRCIESMGHDVAERDGTTRSSRTVSWTISAVLALRGYLARSLTEVAQALDGLQSRRSRMLSRVR